MTAAQLLTGHVSNENNAKKGIRYIRTKRYGNTDKKKWQLVLQR